MTQRHLAPIFNPNAEAHAMQSLNAVMMIFQTALRPIGPQDLVELQHSLGRLVDCLFPIEGNSADFAGFAPLPSGHYVHPIKTAEVAALLGRSAGMPRSKLITLATSAALMNVGYLQLKQSLIDEPRNLMDGEWEQQMHAHPAHSVAALTASDLAHDAIVAIGQHHERWDGSGYPHGARGSEIGAEARMLAIADTFAALRSQRPHRPALPAGQALGIIRDGAGQLFEPGLVDAFVDVINTYAEKEEGKAGAAVAADTRAAEAAAAAQRAREQRAHEDAGKPTRDQRQDAVDDSFPPAQRPAGQQRSTVGPPAARTSPPSAARSTRPIAPARTSRAPLRARPEVRNVAPRRARTLFSTDVYLRGASGHWLD